MVSLIKLVIYFIVTMFTIVVHAKDNKIYTVESKKAAQSTLQYDGTLIPGNAAELLSPGKVTVQAKHFNFGDKVQAGQLLFELTSPELIQQFTQAKMDLLESTQSLEKLQHWSTSSEMLRAKYNVNKNKQQCAHANRCLMQTKKLFKSGIVSQEEYLAEQRAYEESKQNYQNAKQFLVEVSQKGGQRTLELTKMKHAQIQEKVALLSHKVADLKMHAPISGVILAPPQPKDQKAILGLTNNKYFEENQDLALIADLDHISVQINVDEFDIIKLRKEMNAQIALLAIANVPLHGKIQEINIQTHTKQENHQAAKFDVKIAIDNIPQIIKEKILLGMSAQVKFLLTAPVAVLIPKQAVYYDNKVPYVLLFKGDPIDPQKQVITVGETSNEYVAVQGIQSGDKIILPS